MGLYLLKGLVLLVFSFDLLTGEASLHGERYFEFAESWETTLIAKESIWFLIVNVATECALQSIFTTRVANSMLRLYWLATSWTRHVFLFLQETSLNKLCLSVALRPNLSNYILRQDLKHSIQSIHLYLLSLLRWMLMTSFLSIHWLCQSHCLEFYQKIWCINRQCKVHNYVLLAYFNLSCLDSLPVVPIILHVC